MDLLPQLGYDRWVIVVGYGIRDAAHISGKDKQSVSFQFVDKQGMCYALNVGPQGLWGKSAPKESPSDIAEDTSTSPGADVIVSDRVVTTSWGAGLEFI